LGIRELLCSQIGENKRGYLIESLDEGEPDLDVEEAWQHEVARRMEEIQSGKAESVPLLDVKLGARRMLLQRKADHRSYRALLRIGWSAKAHKGSSHITLQRDGYADTRLKVEDL